MFPLRRSFQSALDAAVGVGDEAHGRGGAQAKRHVEGLDRQARFEMIGERPPNEPAQEGVEDDREIDEVLGQTHIGE